MSLLNRKSARLIRRRNNAEKGKIISAYSYHNARNELDENTSRDSSRKDIGLSRTSYWLNRFGFIILLIVGVVCLYSVLGLSTSPNIVFLGNSRDNHLYNLYKPAFLNTSTQLFKASILNHNKITVDTNRITKLLTADFPEFSSISITLPLINHRPIIYLVPSNPSFVLDNTQGRYLLNQSGVAILYGSSHESFNYLDLPTIDDQSGLHFKPGSAALTSQDIAFMQTIIAQLATRRYSVSGMTLPQATSELDVKLTGKSYYVKFNLEDTNPRIQAGNFLATVNYLTTQNITPSQYIDVRTDGRSYYQ